MLEQGAIKDGPTPSLERAVIRAWTSLEPKREPRRIEPLQTPGKGKRTAVYRLEGVGPQGSAVIAKRSRTAKTMLERTIYEEVLPHFPCPTLRCYGCVGEEEGDFCRLFIEDGVQAVPQHRGRTSAGHLQDGLALLAAFHWTSWNLVYEESESVEASIGYMGNYQARMAEANSGGRMEELSP